MKTTMTMVGSVFLSSPLLVPRLTDRPKTKDEVSSILSNKKVKNRAYKNRHQDQGQFSSDQFTIDQAETQVQSQNNPNPNPNPQPLPRTMIPKLAVDRMRQKPPISEHRDGDDGDDDNSRRNTTDQRRGTHKDNDNDDNSSLATQGTMNTLNNMNRLLKMEEANQRLKTSQKMQLKNIDENENESGEFPIRSPLRLRPPPSPAVSLQTIRNQ